MVDKSLMVHKVCSAAEWAELERNGVLPLNADDARDGFVHLSAPDQVKRTIDKFFAGRSDLVLLTLPIERLGERLVWERSASGTVYPHLYGTIDRGDVLDARLLPNPQPASPIG